MAEEVIRRPICEGRRTTPERDLASVSQKQPDEGALVVIAFVIGTLVVAAIFGGVCLLTESLSSASADATGGE